MQRKSDTVAVIGFYPLRTRCGFFIFSPSSLRNSGTGWVMPRTCRRIRRQDHHVSRRGRAVRQDFRDHYGLDDCYLGLRRAEYRLVTAGPNLRAKRTFREQKVRFILKSANEFAGPRRGSFEAAAHAESGWTSIRIRRVRKERSPPAAADGRTVSAAGRLGGM